MRGAAMAVLMVVAVVATAAGASTAAPPGDGPATTADVVPIHPGPVGADLHHPNWSGTGPSDEDAVVQLAGRRGATWSVLRPGGTPLEPSDQDDRRTTDGVIASAPSTDTRGQTSTRWYPGASMLQRSAGPSTVAVTQELNLTPGRPGAVQVTLRTIVPDGARNVSVGLSTRASVVNASGFARQGGRYRFTAPEGRGVLTYSLSVNRTTTSGEFEAVDAGPWALVRTPAPSIKVDGATLDRRYAVDGEGTVGPGLTYLGAHRTYNRSVAGQRLSLVVPQAAEMRSRPEAILDALSNAARTTQVGDRDDEVLFVAAPTTVDWAYAAQQIGDADAWVQADQSLYDPRNAWLHEYIHTRQAFRPTRETRWLVEGTATYYAALSSLRQGLIDFETFRRHLLSGTAGRNARAVLADPSTWRGNNAEYVKGALVVAELDRQIRERSGGWQTFQSVLRGMNDHEGRIRLATFGSLVGVAGDRRVRAVASQYATESVAPDTWGAAAHRSAFGWRPPEVSTDLSTVHADGPGGVRHLGDSPDEVVVATDEHLVATVSVENAGDRPAAFVVPFRVNFTAVNRTVDRVDADGRAATRVSYAFDRPGTYYVGVGGEAFQVRVVEPVPSARVTGVYIARDDGTVTDGVTVVTMVRNGQDRPAKVSLPLTVDGEVVTTRTVSVGPNQVRRVETTVDLPSPGTHRVVVAGESARVTVRQSGHVVTSATPAAVSTESGLLSPTPAASAGVGALAVLVLTAVGGLVVGRRYR